MTTTQVAVRLPSEQLESIDALVGSSFESRSDVIRRAIEQFLYRHECERDARIYELMPFTDAELALGDDVESWKLTPAW